LVDVSEVLTAYTIRASPSETSVKFYETVWPNVPEECYIQVMKEIPKFLNSHLGNTGVTTSVKFGEELDSARHLRKKGEVFP
jgi:hypothetical protein